MRTMCTMHGLLRHHLARLVCPSRPRRDKESPDTPPRVRGTRGWLAGWLLIGIALPAAAQFERAPEPRPMAAPLAAMATEEPAYRIDAARHIYLRYADRIHDGLLPPLLHAIAGVRTTIDAAGQVRRIEITREPAVAREVLPWIERMIRAAAPYPRPPAGLDEVVWNELWLIDRGGSFQLHTLSEGQQQVPAGDDTDEDDEDGDE